ncbi:hypothetical protein [Desmospora activa]|uniref:Glycerophosphoryl diester phosphodiesterase family protein n=1 Tax=Desmospora activa DSM 45169 TaxID=1121389 RepID=A0A2T4Z8I6_9BACL|nr:hypothetical protein [Desmospora activa]PTM58175.1 hypothetical protein C8J48_0753 [Desmospora activa DSM 45169]
MVESFRLINHHGMKLWISALFGGITVTVLLLIPHLLLGLLLRSEMSHLIALGQSWLDAPGAWREVGAQLLQAVQKSNTILIGYGVLLSLFTLFSALFYASGLMGVVRQAAVEQRVSLGHFFACGFRYLLRTLVLVLIQAAIFILFTALWWFLWPLLPTDWYWQVSFFIVSTGLLLFLAAASCHMWVVMVTEEMGAIRSFGYGFTAVFRRFGSTFVSLFGASFAGILGTVIVIFFTVFPWLILQLLNDSTIATIVGVLFGGLLLLILGPFPSICALAVLFQRYLTHIQNDLFPEDRIKPMFLQAGSGNAESAAARESIASGGAPSKEL